jgi:MshEN domain
MRVRIGELLIQAGAINREQLGEALRHQAKVGGRLGSSLIALGLIDDKRLCATLSAQLHIPAVTAEQLERVPAETVGRLEPEVARRLRAVPVREDQGKLWVALAEPTDPDAYEELWRVSGMQVRVMVAPERVILDALDRHYGFEPGALPSAFSPTEARSGPIPPAAPLPSMALDSMTGFLDEAPARPAGRRANRPMSSEQLVSRLSAATQDEEILQTALEFVAQHAGGAALLLLKTGELRGYNAIGLDLAVARRARAQLDELPLLQQVCTSGEVYVGIIAQSSLGRLSEPLGVTGELLAVIVPVRVGRRPVGVVIGVDATDSAVGGKPELERLAVKIDHALHIVHLRRLLVAP